ncbi:MAG TPA: EamA family transporter [Arenibaculum sp.]|nr:EamA family transporter [Arenibaculum sp.]
MAAIPLFILEAAFVLAWSSGFVGAKLGVPHADPFTLLFWRFLLVAVLLFTLLWWRDGPWIRSKSLLGHVVVTGLLAQGVYLACVFQAIDLGVSAGLTALVAATQPLVTAALARPVLGERVGRRQWLGLVIGMAGVFLVVGHGALGDGPQAGPFAYSLPVFAVLGLTAATLYQRRLGGDAPILPSLAIQAAATAALFGCLGALSGGLAVDPSAGFLLAVGWLTLFSTFGAYGLLWLLLRRCEVTRVASLVYLTPPVTMIWALLMFGEMLSAVDVVGLGIAALGVGLVQGRSANGACPEPSPTAGTRPAR